MVAKVAQIRRDLWNAALDFRNGQTYVWDGSFAVEATPDDTRPQLPTIDLARFVEWKRSFVEAKKVVGDEALNSRLEHWATQNLPTRALPLRLQGAWNAELKTRVRELLERWFAANGLARPDGFLPMEIPARPEDQRARPPQVEELRQAIVAAVGNMSYRELLEIKLPSIALLRR